MPSMPCCSPLQVDPESVSLDYSVRHNLKWVARALDKPVSDVTVLILDRPRCEVHILSCFFGGGGMEK